MYLLYTYQNIKCMYMYLCIGQTAGAISKNCLLHHFVYSIFCFVLCILFVSHYPKSYYYYYYNYYTHIMLLLKEDFFVLHMRREILMFVLNPLEMQASSPYYYYIIIVCLNIISISHTHILYCIHI